MKKLIIIILTLVLVLTACSNSEQKTYYEKGVEAYSSGDYTLAKNYFSRANGYEDSDIYIDSINEIIENESSTTVESLSITTETFPSYISENSETAVTTKNTIQGTPDSTTQVRTKTTIKSTPQGTTNTTTRQTTKATTQTTTKATTLATTTEPQRSIQYSNAVYDGDIVDGEPNGYGEMLWTDGASYRGEWQNGLRHGFGSMIWTDRSSYEGAWEKDLMHGFGSMIFSNGDKYIGDWDKDNISGYGKFYWTNGDKYEGEWLNGELNGIGTYTMANGETYSGKWENGELVVPPTTSQTTTATIATTTEAELDRIYQNQLLSRVANVIKSARATESDINAKISDLIGRGGLYSSVMESYKNQLVAVQTDIANLNTLYSLIENAESNEELLEYEKAIISFESVY